MSRKLRILFTAFEPSGDALVQAVARAFGEMGVAVEMWGFAGVKAADAGVRLIENTTEHSAMGAGAAAQVLEHKRRLKVLRQWLQTNEIDVLVPVDSPAANWSICKLVRKHGRGAKIVHMVLPQIWAWAGWRIRRLRKLSDHVLCMLPFEPEWLRRRGVEGTFIGHPLFDPPPCEADYQQVVKDWPGDDSLKVAVLPGSRRSEVTKNFPTMVKVLETLRLRHDRLQVKAAMIDERAKKWALESVGSEQGMLKLDGAFDFEMGVTDAVLSWSDVVLVVSGTATLQTAAHKRPMTVLFEADRWPWLLLGQFVIGTRTFALPNLILGGGPDGVVGLDAKDHLVKEFVPHFGEVQPVVEEMDQLIVAPDRRQTQIEGYEKIRSLFTGYRFGREAAEKIVSLVGEQ